MKLRAEHLRFLVLKVVPPPPPKPQVPSSVIAFRLKMRYREYWNLDAFVDCSEMPGLFFSRNPGWSPWRQYPSSHFIFHEPTRPEDTFFFFPRKRWHGTFLCVASHYVVSSVSLHRVQELNWIRDRYVAVCIRQCLPHPLKRKCTLYNPQQR